MSNASCEGGAGGRQYLDLRPPPTAVAVASGVHTTAVGRLKVLPVRASRMPPQPCSVPYPRSYSTLCIRTVVVAVVVDVAIVVAVIGAAVVTAVVVVAAHIETRTSARKAGTGSKHLLSLCCRRRLGLLSRPLFPLTG